MRVWQRGREVQSRKGTEEMPRTPAGRIFLLESPNALDLLEGTGEARSLSQVCKLFGHDIVSFRIRDKNELRQTLMYISSVGWHEDSGEMPIFIHLSAHGSNNALAIGSDDVTWDKLAKLIIKTFGKIYNESAYYKGPIVLVVSSCQTDGKTISKHLRVAYKKDKLPCPPEYVFVFDDAEVAWQDAVVAWTMFYREVPSIDFSYAGKKGAIQRLLKNVKRSGYGNLSYFRWDSERRQYMRWSGSFGQ